MAKVTDMEFPEWENRAMVTEKAAPTGNLGVMDQVAAPLIGTLNIVMAVATRMVPDTQKSSQLKVSFAS